MSEPSSDEEFARRMFEVVLLRADLALRAGDLREAHIALAEALEVAALRVQLHPERTDGQREMALAYRKIGQLAEAKGQPADARSWYRGALALNESALEDHANDPELLQDLSASWVCLAALERAQGNAAEAEHAHAQAREHEQRALAERAIPLARAHQAVAELRKQLDQARAIVQIVSGGIAADRDLADDASLAMMFVAEHYELAMQSLGLAHRSLTRALGQATPRLRSRIRTAQTHFEQAEHAMQRGDQKQADELLERALLVCEGLLREPRDAS